MGTCVALSGGVRSRDLLACACVAVTVLAAASTQAKGRPVRACSASYSAAQERQKSGELRQARELLLECARSACGAALQHRCAAEASKVNEDIAWVTPVVADAGGQPVARVQIRLDGRLVATKLDGHAMAIDPGVHEVVVTAHVGKWPGRDMTATRKVMIAQGQRGPLPIAMPSEDEEAAGQPPLELPPAPAPAPAAAHDETASNDAGKEESTDEKAADAPAPSANDASQAPVARHGPSGWTYVLGGLGAVGLAGGGLLTYWGNADNKALAQCSPNCQPASVQHIRQLYLGADVSFGVGAAALGLSALLFVTTRGGGEAAASPPPVSVDVRPTRSGAFATLQGAF